jgi:hypothetical protein
MSKRLPGSAGFGWAASLGLLSALAAAGCGPRVGQVWGKVIYQGKPLPSGTVIFVARDGSRMSAVIAKDQTYTITNAPPGLVRIAVKSHPRVPPALSRSSDPNGPAQAPAVELPPRYADPDQSGLTYTVKKGRHNHNIKLDP